MVEGLATYGAIEAGGTKFICAIGDATGALLDETRIETRDPDATLADVTSYFKLKQDLFAGLRSLGIGSFGPLDLRRDSPTFGRITSTPKPGWANIDLLGRLCGALGLPAELDTDVNAAALGELRWGAGQGLASLAYVTVGTGIGVGIIQHGRAVHGLVHPELGHARVRRHPDDRFAGICPFHGDCLEGLSNGPAVTARLGGPLDRASEAHPIWDVEAHYLGELCALLVLSHSPQRILIGGGVMQAALFPRVRDAMRRSLNGYVKSAALDDPGYVCPPALGPRAGVKGALALAIAGDASRRAASA